ncbi:hypothetical protein CXX84_10080 [Arthrobacter sp. AFG7.2]|uniref:hypothetical protein n=1 Tax=Arthrobacter sp. AFG7.2 TaxID=1688693 RepID=UPI000C9E91D0|nr:hypothetical protein [Arthrobacter sp. AFG7.2]PNI08912.1 hypothetical protein CXX84_10080 [Arthrobacter sp. AFG7.2]
MTAANMPWKRRLFGVLVIACLAGGPVAACGEVPEAAPAATGLEAATLEEVEGQDVSRITLTEKAAERLGVTTGAVETVEGKLQVPYSSLIYDASGGTWVYTNPEPLVFIREPVAVERIEAPTVKLASGPQPGTKIVTVGAAELLGAELDTAH